MKKANRNRILYISTNDGSDMRIAKEIKSLATHSDVIFLGMGRNEVNCYVSEYCAMSKIVIGNRRSIYTYLKQLVFALKIILKFRINSIHLINENLMIMYFPIAIFKYTVLDLFDSVFLRVNQPSEKLFLVKYLFYFKADCIIVTDQNRLLLMPKYFQPKCIILENYPNRILNLPEKVKSERLRIMYYGWMGLGRGTEIIKGLLEVESEMKVYMAGWFCDEETKKLLNNFNDQIEFLGVLKQEDAIKFASANADFILCVYEPLNQNNINASPNKIYDAILIETPVIVNNEVKISDWISRSNLGFDIGSYKVKDFKETYESLVSYKKSFVFNPDFRDKYSWESIEKKLWQSHKINV